MADRKSNTHKDYRTGDAGNMRSKSITKSHKTSNGKESYAARKDSGEKDSGRDKRGSEERSGYGKNKGIDHRKDSGKRTSGGRTSSLKELDKRSEGGRTSFGKEREKRYGYEKSSGKKDGAIRENGRERNGENRNGVTEGTWGRESEKKSYLKNNIENWRDKADNSTGNYGRSSYGSGNDKRNSDKRNSYGRENDRKNSSERNVYGRENDRKSGSERNVYGRENDRKSGSERSVYGRENDRKSGSERSVYGREHDRKSSSGKSNYGRSGDKSYRAVLEENSNKGGEFVKKSYRADNSGSFRESNGKSSYMGSNNYGDRRKSERGRTDSTDRNRTNQNNTNQNRTDRNRTDRNRTNQNNTNQNRTDQSNTEKRRTSNNTPYEESYKKRNHDSKEKKTPPIGCPIYERCGGCLGQEEPYEVNLTKKQAQLEELLSEFCEVDTIIGMENPNYYRNKVHAVFDHDRENPICGVYEEGTHKVIPIENCRIENQKASAIILSIRDMLKSFKIKTFDEDSGHGLFRHVLVRTGLQSGEIMVVLVLASLIMPSKNNFVKALLKLQPEITTIIINENYRKTSIILGEKEQIIYGKGFIQDTLCGKVFRISPKSFYQINPVQTEILYKTAISYAELTGKEIILDAYCGIGTIGMIASEQAKKVISVELNADAVRDAKYNAKKNEITNIDFYTKDAGEFMSQVAEEDSQQIDVVFMDPPRAGSDEKFMDAMIKLNPKKIIYISCNPYTLARDLKYLCERGYEAKKAAGIDLFPWTKHVETAVLLVRKP